MSSKGSDPTERLNALREILEEDESSTQEDLVSALHRQGFPVTQSTISRDLMRLGAIKTRDGSGRTVYRLPNDMEAPVPVPPSELKGLLLNIRHNGSLIVIQTAPGSASLVARQLDQAKPDGILGTIAGDDTIFVAPSSSRQIKQTMQTIINQFS